MKEEIINTEIKCLDKGFVRLVDIMGDDASIVQAARVSYGKGTKSVNEDRGLIRYLMRNKHTSPFEMVEFKFHVKLPIFIARQWIRHRTANVNEYSGRYSEMSDEFYIPDLEQIKPQSTNNKQGRSENAIEESAAREIAGKMNDVQQMLYTEYKDLLGKDIAREIARINLPLSSYTEWYWKIDLHNLFHFLRLRLDAHAQYEIRVFAQAMADIVKAACPLAWEAFEDYTLNAVNFYGKEISILKKMINTELPSDSELEKLGLSKRETAEFKKKMDSII